MSEKFEITVSDSKKIIFKNIRNLAGIVLVTPFFAHTLYTFRKRTNNSAGRFKDVANWNSVFIYRFHTDIILTFSLSESIISSSFVNVEK